MARFALVWSVFIIATVSCVSQGEYDKVRARSSELERDNAALKGLLKKQQRDIENALAEKDEAEKLACELRTKLSASDKRIGELSREAKKLHAQIEKLVDELAAAKADAVVFHKKSEDTKKIVKSLANDIQVQKEAVKTLKATVNELEKKNVQLMQSAKENQKNMDDLKAALAKARKVADTVTNAENKLKNLQTQLAALQAENAKLKSENNNLRAQTAALKSENERLKAENKKLKSQGSGKGKPSTAPAKK